MKKVLPSNTKNKKQPIKRVIRYVTSVTAPSPNPPVISPAKQEFLYDFKKEHLW